MADILWNWIDPSWNQFLIINIGRMILNIIVTLVIRASGYTKSKFIKTMAFLGFLTFLIAYIYSIIIHGRSIYLMVDNGVKGSDWFLLIMYLIILLILIDPDNKNETVNKE